MLDYLEYNTILYNETIKYLKSRNVRISEDLFLCVLAACRLVYTKQALIRSACELAGAGVGQEQHHELKEHFQGKEVSKYVSPIMKIAQPKLEKHEIDILDNPEKGFAYSLFNKTLPNELQFEIK